MIPIVSVDASLTATGIATIIPASDTHQIHSRLIKPKAHHGRGMLRIAVIVKAIRNFAIEHEARLVAIENYPFHMEGSAVTKLAELGGCIRLALAQADIPYIAISNTSIKKYATGSGRANKDDMVGAARTLTGYTRTSHDEADARFLLALVYDAIGQPIIDVPDHHRDAVQAVIPLLPKRGLL